MTSQPQKIEQVLLQKLVPYARNARTHSDAQVLQIAASINEFGFCNPVLIDADNGIVAGHGRVLAAEHLGLKRVPCLRLSHLTEAQRRAYILADNKIAENSGWDESLLAQELAFLDEMKFDTGLMGFDQETLDRLISSALNTTTTQAETNDTPESSTKEINENDFEFDCKCPKCGFEFNRKA